MGKYPKKIKNDWGVFEVSSASYQNLVLDTTYPTANRRSELGYTITIGDLDSIKPNRKSYDGIGLTVRHEYGINASIYLEIGGNQLEALRQHLNQWHENLQKYGAM